MNESPRFADHPRTAPHSPGAYQQDGAHFLLSISEIAFEASIAILTIVKAFRPSPILDDSRYVGVGEGSLSSAAAAP